MARDFADWLTPAQIEQRVAALVAHARQVYGIPDGCNGVEACEHIGLQCSRGSLTAGTDGFWSNRLIVVNHTVTWPARIEFTIFHEIMHYLLDEDGELIEFFTDTLSRDDGSYKLAIEKCCNQGAAEFLMPQESVRNFIDKRGFSVHLVEELSNWSGASLIAAAAQLAVCSPYDCFVVICSSRPLVLNGQVTPKVWVDYSFAPHRGKYVLAPSTLIPSDHTIAIANERGVSLSESSFIPFRSGRRMPSHCEVVWVGKRQVALLLLEQPVSKSQRSLFG